MFSLKKRHVIGPMVVITLLLGLTAWSQQSKDERYCNLFAESITLENAFDPNSPVASLPDGVEVPEATLGGCYETRAEALCAGTEGAICLPKDARAKDIDWAVRDYEYRVLGGHPEPGPWGWQSPDSRSE